MSSVVVYKFGVGEKISKTYNVSLQRMFNRIKLLKYRYRGSFPSDYVATFENDFFDIIFTQPSNMRSEHWIMFANARHELHLAHSLA